MHKIGAALIAEILLFFAAPSLALAQSAASDTCVTCHDQAREEAVSRPVLQMKDDIHARRGLSCANCHGGDPTQSDPKLAMDPRRGFVARPGSKQVQLFCGKCHSDPEFMRRFNPAARVDQETEYRTSVHGKLVAAGDATPATCISCHGHHGIRQVNDPNAPVHPTKVVETCGRCHSNTDYMRRYSIPTDQAAKYLSSVHAEALLKRQDLSAPTCNDCHGNHGAAPPGLASVANVCGTCHVRQSELFQKSPHKGAFEALELADCLVCHSNHDVGHATDAMIGVNDPAPCAVCHSAGDAGYEGAQRMGRSIDELVQHLGEAETLLDRAARAGMEVSRAKFDLNETRDKLINARVVIHSFSPQELEAAAGPGIESAKEAHQAGLAALDELQFRRKGLAASLIVIVIAVVAIYLKIRQIESRNGRVQ